MDDVERGLSMLNREYLIGLLFTLAGASVMVASILKTKSLLRVIPFIHKNHQEFIRKNLAIHRMLMVFFLLGYIIFAITILAPMQYVSNLLISFILLAGAIFVFLNLRLQSRMLTELQSTLHGLLPICSHCKKVLCDDHPSEEEHAWKDLEAYLMDHSDTDFSHGICPECMQKYYPEYAPHVQESLRKGKSR